MKVLNLECQQQHQFEGWFASEDDYQSQRERNLVECPICADNTIHKRLSAPRLNLLTSRLESQATVAEPASRSQALVPLEETVSTNVTQESQLAWLKMVQHVVANTEDVGQGFAEEARKMHYGEAEERNIRGQVSIEETRSLLEEGIPVMPLPLPAALKGSVH
jgi:hypothetical protein